MARLGARAPCFAVVTVLMILVAVVQPGVLCTYAYSQILLFKRGLNQLWYAFMIPVVVDPQSLVL